MLPQWPRRRTPSTPGIGVRLHAIGFFTDAKPGLRIVTAWPDKVET
jgi:hypothetical protein